VKSIDTETQPEVVVTPATVEVQKPVESPKPAEKKATKPKRRDDIEAGLLDAIDSHGE